VEQAETAIILAAFKVISEDENLQRDWRTMRLTESLAELYSYGQGYLTVAGFPVAPKDFPSKREIVMVDINICPVFPIEGTGMNSKLTMNRFFNSLRKLLNAHLPLVDPEDSSRHVTDAVLDLDWRRTVYPSGAGVRIPHFVARYQGQIDVVTGDFAV
jgi:hypothetical protein